MKRQVWSVLLLPLLAAVAIGDEDAQAVWKLQRTGVDASLRGLCVVDQRVVWASGSAGTVIRTEDAGETWHDVSVPQAEKLDFRDVHAFDDRQAVIVSAGQPARFYRTQDGGRTWVLSFEHPDENSFFDAFAFWDRRRGIAMSDPVDGRLLLMETRDGGSKWQAVSSKRLPAALPGEAGFAASGTNMTVRQPGHVWIALGGARKGEQHLSSRVLLSRDGANTWDAAMVPIPRNPSSGIFSVAFSDARQGVAVGGDYLQPDVAAGNVALSRDGGQTWAKPAGQVPRGFRSCVSARVTQQQVLWVAVGPTGTDYSTDGGKNWRAASDQGFHAVQFQGRTGFASGTDGRVARWVGP